MRPLAERRLPIRFGGEATNPIIRRMFREAQRICQIDDEEKKITVVAVAAVKPSKAVERLANQLSSVADRFLLSYNSTVD